jgi:hypothetical protein
MKTSARFIIVNSGFGQPSSEITALRTATKLAIELLSTFRSALKNASSSVSSVGTGKPWGAGFTVRNRGHSIIVYFFPEPNIEKKRWEGSLHCWIKLSLLSRIQMKKELDYRNEHAAFEESFRHFVSSTQSFVGVRFMENSEFYKSKAYEN